MQHTERVFNRFAAAYVRGSLSADDANAAAVLWALPIDDLSTEQLETIYQQGIAAGLRLHRFKRTMALARVRRVIGLLHSLQPATLLDIGSGRGTFLWPLLDTFPDLPVTAIDASPQRAAELQAVHSGGITRLSALYRDTTALDFADNAFDTVTALEVLEHIADAQAAVAEIVRVAQRFVVVSVPSKEDDNPEHIHLFDKTQLQTLFSQAGAQRIQCDYVLNHLIAVIKLQRDAR